MLGLRAEWKTFTNIPEVISRELGSIKIHVSLDSSARNCICLHKRQINTMSDASEIRSYLSAPSYKNPLFVVHSFLTIILDGKRKVAVIVVVP